MKKNKSAFFIFIILTVLAFYIINLLYPRGNKSTQDIIKIQNGYKVSVAAKGLKNPSSFYVDDNENIYIAENDEESSDIIKYTKWGRHNVYVQTGLSSPVSYITGYKGKLYVSHKGRVSQIINGKAVDIINGLPSQGDYSNNGIAFGSDGMIYICQGSATNSGIVGQDNYERGWLKKNKYFHDIPPYDMYTSGAVYKSLNLFTADVNDTVATSPFMPFGVNGIKGTEVKGQILGNACILRTTLDGSFMDVFAWGIRNPTSIIMLPDGSIYAAVQGMEDRGARPIAGGRDYIYQIKKGMWLGWPDYEGGEAVCQMKFKSKNNAQPQFITEMHPLSSLQKPMVSFAESGRIGIIDMCRSSSFGVKGNIYIPFKSGKTETGKVVKLDTKTGEVSDFISSKKLKSMDTPVQCLFSSKNNLYVLYQNDGILLKVEKEPEITGNNLLPKYIPIEYFIGAVAAAIIIYVIITVKKDSK